MSPPRAARACILALAGVSLVGPLLFTLVVACSPRGIPHFVGPLAYPPGPTFENVREAITRGRALTCFANSALVATTSASLGTVLGFPAAYALSRSRSRWKGVILALILSLRLLPKTPALAAQYHLVHLVGLMDNPLAVSLVRGGGILLAIWLMKASIDRVPRHLEHAAVINGLGRGQVLWRIIVPLAAPGIGGAFLLEFVSAWNSFLLPLLFLSSEHRMTVSLGIDRFLSGYALEEGPMAAFALLMSLPLLLFFPLLVVGTISRVAPVGSGGVEGRR